MLAEKVQQLWRDAMAGDVASILALTCFAGIYLCITGALMMGLWKREGEAGKKALWSLILTLPVLGWIFYMAFYKLPPSKPPC